MKNTLKHLQPIATTKKIFASVLALLAIYLFTQGTLFGLILLGAAFKLALREGIEIDLAGVKYRKLYSILGFTDGRWKGIPEIEYISVFKTKKKTKSRVIAAEANLDFEVYKVNLFYETNKHIEAFVADEKEEAFAIAKEIASVLNTEIHDATQ